MSKKNGNVFGRRDVLKASALALGAGLLTSESVDAYTKERKSTLESFEAEDYRSSRGDH